MTNEPVWYRAWGEHGVVLGESKTEEYNADCPWCGHAQGLYVNKTTGLFYCQRCMVRGNPTSWFGKILEIEQQLLGASADALKDLSEDRGIPGDLLLGAGVGLTLDGKHFVIPLFDSDGVVRDLRRYRIGDRIRSTSGGVVFPIGFQNMIGVNGGGGEKEIVWICEGEWDAIAFVWAARKSGRTVRGYGGESEVAGDIVLGVPGAGVFKDEWVPGFRDRDVVLLYDADEAGQSGAAMAGEKLREGLQVGDETVGRARRLRWLWWPPSVEKGWDVRDQIVGNGDGLKWFMKRLVGRPPGGVSRSVGDRPDGQSRTIKNGALVRVRIGAGGAGAGVGSAGLSDATKNTLRLLPTDQIGLAEAFVLLHKDRYRCVHGARGKGFFWRKWDSVRWDTDNNDAVRRDMIGCLKQLIHLAVEDPVPQRGFNNAKKLQTLRSSFPVSGAMTIAGSLEPVAVAQDVFDQDPYLLGCMNGFLDLRSGVFSTPDPKKMLTQTVNARWDPKARSRLWESYLKDVTQGDKELERYLAQAVGYCLSGEISEAVLFFLEGPTRTGKTTFLEAVLYMLGDYGVTLPFDVFCKPMGPRRGATPELMRLRGRRFAKAVESERGGTGMDIALLKELSGGDTIAARELYESYISFKPGCKLWLGMNELPRVFERGDAIWSRIQRVPFLRQFPKGDLGTDERLKEKLKSVEEASGILQWAWRGWQDWVKAGGLCVPSVVLEATQEYHHSEDWFSQFIDECVVRDKRPMKELRKEGKKRVSYGDLFSLFKKWCAEDVTRANTSSKTFTKNLRSKGILLKRSNGKDWCEGIVLKDVVNDVENDE